ncbi:MAG: ATP-binding protein [Defluviitaleaceae bacterium]|nr:ATP-binding protein [Defluviitaleaceae bacterium]
MNWFYGLKIRNKLALAFGVVMLSFITAFIFSINTMNSIVFRYNALVNETIARKTSINEANEAFTRMRLVNSSQVIMADNDDIQSILVNTLPEYQMYERLFLESLAGYRQLLLNDIRLSEDELSYRLETLEEIDELHYAYKIISRQLYEAVMSQNSERIQEYYSNILPIVASILDNMQILSYHVSLRAEVESSDVSNHVRIVTNATIVALFISAIFSLLVILFIIKAIITPIGRLQNATAQISGGNLDFPIRSDSADEMGVLSNDIANMVDSIAEMNKTVTIMGLLDTMIYVVDTNHNIVYMNTSMQEAYGLTQGIPKGKKCWELIMNSSRLCKHCGLFNVESKSDSFHEIGVFWDEKLSKWLEIRSAVIRWVDGSLAQFHSFTDVTEKKNSQDRQVMYEEQLKDSAQEAQAASIAKTAFIANTSHEIRTPMNSIIGYSELALDDDISEKTRERLDKILENSRWLLQIINDILDISKIESGKIELENIPFDIHDIFANCQTAIMPLAQEKCLLLHFYAEPVIDKMLLGDPTRLTQILINLLSNAVKFTHKGMIKVSSVIESSSEEYFTFGFEVRDSGIGMSKEQIDKIFAPFIQADVSFTRRYGGTGLGLSITKSLIEAMGGELKVESVPKVGSMFSFTLSFKTLKVSAGRSYTEPIIGQIPKPLFNGEILVCEDSVMNQGVIIEHLEKVGIKTVIASNGKEGVDIVKERIEKNEKPFGLIFMDIHMPVMDGIEAATAIEALNVGTPIVAMTANVMINDQEAYKASGMRETVSKPFTAQVLWRCLLKYFEPVEWLVGNAAQVKEEEQQFKMKQISRFVKNNRNIGNDITSSISSGDIAQAHRLAHNLKNYAGIIGKDELQKVASTVEDGLKNGECRVSNEELNSLKSRLEITISELEPIIANFSPEKEDVNEGSYDTEQILTLINELEPLLESGNTRYTSFIEKLRGIPLCEQIVRHLEDYNAPEAAAALAELKTKI